MLGPPLCGDVAALPPMDKRRLDRSTSRICASGRPVHRRRHWIGGPCSKRGRAEKRDSSRVDRTAAIGVNEKGRTEGAPSPIGNETIDSSLLHRARSDLIRLYERRRVWFEETFNETVERFVQCKFAEIDSALRTVVHQRVTKGATRPRQYERRDKSSSIIDSV